MSVYRGIRPDRSGRLEIAGTEMQRRVAYAFASVITERDLTLRHKNRDVLVKGPEIRILPVSGRQAEMDSSR
jgi:hypothetical protein